MDSSQETLSYEEFEERLWTFLPRSLISVADVENNRDWAENLVHEAWRVHRNSGVPYQVVMKLVEQFLQGIKVYKPLLYQNR
jgi:hypothetical protein